MIYWVSEEDNVFSLVILKSVLKNNKLGTSLLEPVKSLIVFKDI